MSSPAKRLMRIAVFAAAAITGWPNSLPAQGKPQNPASKLFVSDVEGEAQIDTGENIEDLNKRSVYNAQGTVIETKRPERGQDRSKNYSTMVYSNGTGAFFDADTRVEIRRFVQEPFVPNRSDSDVEPSISQTQAFVARGSVGLCTSKLVAGSVMSYTTPLASVNISGGKIVIQAGDRETRISMLEGESTVRAGAMDMGGHTLHAGQQAVIRPSRPGQPNTLQIIKIPSDEAPRLDDQVAMACMAKKTVYFEVRGRQEGEVNAFNQQNSIARHAGDPIIDSNGEIIAVPVVPSTLPVQFTVSPASLVTPGQASAPVTNLPPGQGGPPGG
ncbi:MAG TPA: hypothetical protein VHE61_02765 [Opitutaceae bacterium]|nr:hypothetical protein [Opitutaceae bacterium]